MDYQKPTVTGGNGALTYSLSPALPLGLSFDPATQTIWGLLLGAIIEVQKYLLLK